MPTVLFCADAWSGPPPCVEGVEIVMVDELCPRPKAAMRAVPADETELAVAIHRSETNLGSLQAAVRREGFDPLAVGVIDLEAVGSPDDVAVTLEGALARMRAFPGTRPEQIKLLPTNRTTRRGFLSIGVPTYTGAPWVAPERCAASRGCDVCTVRCPTDAVTWSNGAIVFDPSACVVCGTCVTACPLGAIENPTASPAAFADEIDTVVAASSGRMAIEYRCREATVPAEPGWYQVEVPCTGMLTAAWLVAPWLLGAPAVEAIPCGEGGCGFGNDDHLEHVVEDAAKIVELLRPVPGGPRSRSDTRAWLAPGGTARLIDMLAPPDVTVEFAAADVGMVEIDERLCTACERCAMVCPTSALESGNGLGVRITFDPRLCVACGQCLTVCPEPGTITLRRGFDLADRRRGRRTLIRDTTPLCDICGQPVAPTSMLAKISELLGAEGSATMALLERRCLDCRGR